MRGGADQKEVWGKGAREIFGEGRPGTLGEAPDGRLDGFAILWTSSHDRLPGLPIRRIENIRARCHKFSKLFNSLQRKMSIEKKNRHTSYRRRILEALGPAFGICRGRVRCNSVPG